MKLSLVIPFSGSTADLIPDLKQATDGAEVVVVDNASDEQARQAITEYLMPAVYIRNDENKGFAAGNNQGYAKATGDIIIFLNSDVAGSPAWLNAALADIKEGALYGPSMGQQLVAGRWLPYVEGWCIGATRATWDRLSGDGRKHFGPWDDHSYPGPYWEDNDLCFRAAQCGLSLVQTGWGNYLQHKGGRTAGPIARHAQSFEQNRRTFSLRVQAALGGTGGPPTPTYARYMQECFTQSDIQQHLPLLYSLARGNVLELGTRTGVSTAALLAGVEKRGGHVWSVDVQDCGALYQGHPQWTFVQGDSRDTSWTHHPSERNASEAARTPDQVDVLLIDTEHNYSQAAAELAAWSSCLAPGAFVLMHDPETFPGVRRAAEEFCAARGWPLTFVLPCNGMAVIEVPR
jgi:hypothetical protein